MKRMLLALAMVLVGLQMQAQETTVTDFAKPDMDTLSLRQHPTSATYHPHYVSYMPPRMGLEWGTLHQGLNLSLGASVFAPLGKHSSGGAGFTQSLAAFYAVPLTERLSLSVGGYFENINWGHHSYRDAGISAVLGYRFNDQWEAFVYGQKSILDQKMPLPLYYMNDVGDRIGAAVRYSPNHTFSVTVSVEGRSEPSWLPVYPFAARPNHFSYSGLDW